VPVCAEAAAGRSAKAPTPQIRAMDLNMGPFPSTYVKTVSNTPGVATIRQFRDQSRPLASKANLRRKQTARSARAAAEVTERDKDVRYSSRTRLTTNNLREKHNVRHAINELHKLLPPELAGTEQAQRLYAYGCVTEMDIVQLIYRPMEPLGAFKDFEFSRSTMAARWKQGLSDVLIALQASPWLAPMPKELGVRVFDVMHDILTSRS